MVNSARLGIIVNQFCFETGCCLPFERDVCGIFQIGNIVPGCIK